MLVYVPDELVIVPEDCLGRCNLKLRLFLRGFHDSLEELEFLLMIVRFGGLHLFDI